MMIALVFAAALAAGEPTAAPSATTAAAAPASAAKDAPKPNKDGLVCKKEPVLGSRMPTRVCMTQAEWDQRKQDGRDQVDQAQKNQGLISH